MSDTLGSLIDKLYTVDMKLWNNVELMHAVRHMTLDEFKVKYFSDSAGVELLWSKLKTTCDLNVQRSNLIDEIDERIVLMIQTAITGTDLTMDGSIQHKHKTC